MLIIRVASMLADYLQKPDRAVRGFGLCAGVYVQISQALEVGSSSIVSNQCRTPLGCGLGIFSISPSNTLVSSAMINETDICTAET